jgi:hypothetical protein
VQHIGNSHLRACADAGARKRLTQTTRTARDEYFAFGKRVHISKQRYADSSFDLNLHRAIYDANREHF